MHTILVTGGAGFIGSNFVRSWIAEKGTAVVNLDKLTYAGNLDSLKDLAGNPRHVFVRGDIGDGPLVSTLLAQHRPQAVVHFAAESHVDRSIDGPAAFVDTNAVGTFRLLEASRRHWSTLPEPERSAFRFLHVSTDEVYGSLGPMGKFTETSPYAPNSPYSASKAAGDHFARAYHYTYGLPVVVTNCSNNYGPYQFPEKLIPLMVLNALEGKPLPVYGDGQQVRDWLYVEDHCRALRTIAAIVDRLRPAAADRPAASLIRFVPDRPGHDRRYAIDAGKIREQLGWTPRESFESGLERTVRWYIDHRAWVERITSGKYRRERLGLGPHPAGDLISSRQTDGLPPGAKQRAA